MKRRTRLGSSPIKVFGLYVYPQDGSRTKVHLASFASVYEARKFVVTAITAVHDKLLPHEFDPFWIERGDCEFVSSFSALDQQQNELISETFREATMHPQGASLERASAADIDRYASVPLALPLREPDVVLIAAAIPIDNTASLPRGELPDGSSAGLAPGLERCGGA